MARRVSGGDIVCLHDAPEQPGGPLPGGVTALRVLLAELGARGLHSTTLSELEQPPSEVGMGAAPE